MSRDEEDSDTPIAKREERKVGVASRRERQIWELRKEKERVSQLRKDSTLERTQRLKQRLLARDKIAQKGAKVVSEDAESEEDFKIPKIKKKQPQTMVTISEDSSTD